LHDRATFEKIFFNLVGAQSYERVPNYRNLSDAEEVALRGPAEPVTDTAFRKKSHRRDRTASAEALAGRPTKKSSGNFRPNSCTS